MATSDLLVFEHELENEMLSDCFGKLQQSADN